MIKTLLTLSYLVIQLMAATYEFKDVVIGSDSCSNGYQNTKTFSYSGSYSSPPQIFILLAKSEYSYGDVGFSFKLVTVTTTSFTVNYSCPKGTVQQVKLLFHCFNDQNLQVIYNFNMDNPTNMIFPHQNPNALKAIISVISLVYTGPIDFNLAVTNLDSEKVTVGITQDTAKAANLKQIGYAILLGTAETFTNFQTLSPTNYYTSSGFPNEPNTWIDWIKLSKHIQFKNGNIIFFAGTGYTKYTFGAWTGTSVQNSQQATLFKYTSYTIVTNFYEYFSMRISRKEVENINLEPQIMVGFEQMKKSFSQIQTSTIIIDQAATPLIIQFQFKCISGKKIKAEFNKCNNCAQGKTLIQYKPCYNNNQIVAFYPKFKQSPNCNVELTVQIESTYSQITQVLYNNVKSQKVIAKVEFVNS